MIWRPPKSTLFPYPTLFRSMREGDAGDLRNVCRLAVWRGRGLLRARGRSEEQTSELQSPKQLLFPPYFLNDLASTEIYTLSLPDALPIYARRRCRRFA